MEITEEQLRHRYQAMATDELADLKAHGGLSEMAERVMSQILSERGTDSAAFADAFNDLRRQMADEDPLASRGDRMVAQLIDGLLALLLLVGVLFGSALLGGAVTTDQALALGGFAFLAYLWLSDALPGGQSVGKRVMKIAVVHVVTGEPCTLVQSVARNATLSFLGILDIVFIAMRERRRLGDHLARTKVIRLAADPTTAA